MKTLKLAMVVLLGVICIFPTLVPNQAQAAATWATCYVNAAGQGASTYKFVKLTDATGTIPAINKTWFSISDTYSGASTILSTVLSAMVSGMKVQVYVTDTVAYSQVQSAYLLDQ